MEIGQVIRAKRKEQELSLREFQDKHGISKTNLSLIERGETSPTTKTLQRIAEALGCDLKELL